MNLKIHHSPLNTALVEQVAKLFVDTFNAPPRNENWTQETALEFIKENMNKGGHLIVAYAQNNNILGCKMGLPVKDLHLLSELKQFLSPHLNIEESGYYISTTMVTKTHQSQGIGKKLIKFHLDYLNTSPYKYIFIRTRCDAVVINHLLKQFDFEVIRTYTAEMGGTRAERHLHMKTLL